MTGDPFDPLAATSTVALAAAVDQLRAGLAHARKVQLLSLVANVVQTAIVIVLVVVC